jgi:hypothetical protein
MKIAQAGLFCAYSRREGNWCVMGEAKRDKDLIEKACMMAHSAPENFP